MKTVTETPIRLQPAHHTPVLTWGPENDATDKFPFLRLPFYNEKCRGDARYWTVPMSGGYEVGRKVGVAMAKCFQRLLSHPERPIRGGEWLPYIVEGMAERLSQAKRKSVVAHLSVVGQMQGFLAEIRRAASRDANDLRLQLFYRSTEAELIAPAIVALTEAAAAKPAVGKKLKTPNRTKVTP